VDELIDVHKDKTTVLQENVKDLSNKSQYVNVVKEDYKPCLGLVFANVKAKRKKCGIERNYVLAALATYFFLRRCLKANKRTEVYYEYMEPFKSLMCLWVRSRSIAATWLEKVVTPLIVPAIKGFAAVSVVLKLERLKVDKHGMSEPMSYYRID
nr:hypothetical protein [Tanacetum cinerariifolium]